MRTALALNAVRHLINPRARFGRWLSSTRDGFRFLRDLRRYAAMDASEPLSPADFMPCLGDWTPTAELDVHYFHLAGWAARRIVARRPERHVDIGSDVIFVAAMSAVTDVEFVDIRALPVELPGLRSRIGSLLALPYADGSLASVSCLHVAEHVGLGRYGDDLDPAGTRKAAAELARVLAGRGTLLFAVPVGRERVCFNAHRVHAAGTIARYFGGLELEEFSGVDDSGTLREHVALDTFDHDRYACGFFCFRKP